MTLTKQQQRVFNYIRAHRGCTTKDIMLGTGIQCPSGRITEMRAMGIKLISVGQVKYPGSKAFEKYAIDEEPTKKIAVPVQLPDNTVRLEYKEVPLFN